MEVYIMTALEAMKRDNNVIGFTSDSCYGAIRLYLNRVKDDSDNTHGAYARYYNAFFGFTLGKDISSVTWDDILKIEYSDVGYFRNYLKETMKNSNNTINQKISSLLPLWKELKKHNDSIDIGTVLLEPLKIRQSHNTGSKALRLNEADMLLDFAKEQSYKGYVKYMFFKTAIVTALRKETLLNATFDDLQQIQDEETGDMYWCLVRFDKTQEEIKPITNEMYDEIMELKSPMHRINMKTDDNRIFPISQQQLVSTLNEFCGEYDIKAKITLHSLRKTSADYANELVGGSIKGIQQQTGHKNTRVLIDHYQGTRATLHNFPGLRMFREEFDIGRLEQLSQEELIDLIKQCDDFVAKQLLDKLDSVNGM